MSERIVSVEFEHNIRNGRPAGRSRIWATFADGKKEIVVSYYVDELRFSAEDFIGLTAEQARELHMRRDTAYLRS